MAGGGKAKPSASGEEPVTIVVPRVQDFLLQTGDTTVGHPPSHTHTHTSPPDYIPPPRQEAV